MRNIDLRRAVLGALILAGGAPLTIGQILAELRDRDHVVLAARRPTETPAKRVADLLRYQLRRGRVERVGRGAYRFVLGSMTTSTAWRCLHWRHVAAQRQAHVPVPLELG